MPERTDIASGMQVLTADGELLGTVREPSSGGFLLNRLGPGRDGEETIPELWVERVDQHVHLNRTGAEAVAGWKSLQFKTSSGRYYPIPWNELRYDTGRGGYVVGHGRDRFDDAPSYEAGAEPRYDRDYDERVRGHHRR